MASKAAPKGETQPATGQPATGQPVDSSIPQKDKPDISGLKLDRLLNI